MWGALATVQLFWIVCSVCSVPRNLRIRNLPSLPLNWDGIGVVQYQCNIPSRCNSNLSQSDSHGWLLTMTKRNAVSQQNA